MIKVNILAVDLLVGGDFGIRNLLSLKATSLKVGNIKVAKPHNNENKTREIDSSGKFSESSKLKNTCNECETPISTYQIPNGNTHYARNK